MKMPISYLFPRKIKYREAKEIEVKSGKADQGWRKHKAITEISIINSIFYIYHICFQYFTHVIP